MSTSPFQLSFLGLWFLLSWITRNDESPKGDKKAVSMGLLLLHLLLILLLLLQNHLLVFPVSGNVYPLG